MRCVPHWLRVNTARALVVNFTILGYKARRVLKANNYRWTAADDFKRQQAANTHAQLIQFGVK